MEEGFAENKMKYTASTTLTKIQRSLYRGIQSQDNLSVDLLATMTNVLRVSVSVSVLVCLSVCVSASLCLCMLTFIMYHDSLYFV